MSMDFGFDVISAEEYDRQRVLYEPLTAAIRKLIDAGIHTEIDEATAREAKATIEMVTAMLERKKRTVTTLRHEDTGRPLAWANPAVGVRNAIAPPMVIHHEPGGRAWSEFTLSGAYEGPPGWVHGGICALVLDHILGEAAREGLTKPKFTGTIDALPAWHAVGAAARRGVHRPDRRHEDLCAGLPERRRGHTWRPRACSSGRPGHGTPDEVLCQHGVPRHREVVEIAKAADDLGYDGMAIPDHVINLETLQTPYPYTKDGSRRWEAFTDWPDPWVIIGAIALVTTGLHFVTTVYLPAMRDPYSAAKSIGTAAYLAGGRLELGIGVGWCEEEFTLMGQRFDRRGRRTDEMLELMKALWAPGWTEFEGWSTSRAGASVLAASGARWAPRTRRRRCAAGASPSPAARPPAAGRGAAGRALRRHHRRLRRTARPRRRRRRGPGPGLAARRRRLVRARGHRRLAGRGRRPCRARARDRLRVHRRGVHGQPRLLQALDARGRGLGRDVHAADLELLPGQRRFGAHRRARRQRRARAPRRRRPRGELVDRPRRGAVAPPGTGPDWLRCDRRARRACCTGCGPRR